MRLSILKSDTGYDPGKLPATVYLDGKELKHCVTADEEKGMTLVNMFNEHGTPFLMPGTGDVARKWLYGKVVICPAPPKHIKEIECKRWLLPRSTTGITLYPFIFYQGKPDAQLRAHELVHVEQVRRMGWLRFYIRYIIEHLRHGYQNNKYEIEAREKAAQ